MHRVNIALTLRAERPEDAAFLSQLFAGSRWSEFASLPWTEAQKRAFLQQQYDLQAAQYKTHHPNAAFSIIEWGSCAIGRFYVDRNGKDIHIIDITLVAEYRNRGMGSELLQTLLAEAMETGCNIKLHVAHSNPARQLYQRLGFRITADEGVYLAMTWRAFPPA